MPYVKITDDKEKRSNFKLALKDAVEKALSPTVGEEKEPVKPIKVLVPFNFNSLSKVVLYGMFTREQFLTPDQANEVIEILNGKASNQFTIILQGEIEKKIEEPEIDPPSTESRQVNIVLPQGFDRFKSFEQYVWLSKESGHILSVEEINDVIDILNGKPSITDTKFNLSFAESLSEVVTHSEVPVEEVVEITPLNFVLPNNYDQLIEQELQSVLTHDSKFSCSIETAVEVLDYLFGRSDASHIKLSTDDGQPIFPFKVDSVEEQSSFKESKLRVTVPIGFNTLKLSDKYVLLTTKALLTPNEANDILDILSGKQPIAKTVYEVVEGFEFEVNRIIQ